MNRAPEGYSDDHDVSACPRCGVACRNVCLDCAPGYTVIDYETGAELEDGATDELIRESLEREPEGAVGAYLAEGEWHWLDDGDPAPCGADDYRTVYVVRRP